MYIFINYWVSTIIGAFAATYTVFMFLIAILTFTEVDGLKRQHVVAELLFYITATFGLFFVAQKEIVPDAYEWL